MSNSIIPPHKFTRPGQVDPDYPAPDACMRCGRPEHEHRAASYAAEAAAADALLDELIGNVRRDLDAGEISPAEAAAERIKVMEEHLITIRELRARYFGNGE